MKTIAIAVQKGGSGKTTTAQNIGAELAAMGCRVLLVDIDPQATLTGSVGVTPVPGKDLAAVMGGKEPGNVSLSEIIMTVSNGIDIVPASINLAYRTELEIVGRAAREAILKVALETVAPRYDVCIIDTPPSLGMLTINALAAANSVLIPIQPTSNDIRGLQSFLQTLQNMNVEINPSLSIFGILLTRYDKRLQLHRQALEEIRTAGLPLFEHVVTQSVRIAETGGQCQPLREYDPRNPNNETYRAIADTIKKEL